MTDFHRLLIVHAAAALAGKGLAVVVAYQVFQQTNSVLALGLLGLVEAIPALSLALYGGHVADRVDRRSILRVTLGTLTICAASLAVLSFLPVGWSSLLLLFGVVFIAGVARGFASPAEIALEAQVVPREVQVKSAAWMASAWLACAILGPLIALATYAAAGPLATYSLLAGLFAVAWVAVTCVGRYPMSTAPKDETIGKSIRAGLSYVWNDQVLLGSMALDLFAVLFGGAVALLPVFAKDILHVGPVELGLLNGATYGGAMVALLWATYRPPIRHAGRNLLFAVAGFGVCIIVFALSESFVLSMVALFLSGICDGVSVVVRRAIVRLRSPDHLRGRIGAVSMMFIGASNELGAFESGLAAELLGTVRSVWIGGLVTLLIVLLATLLAPKLRRLNLEPVEVAKV